MALLSLNGVSKLYANGVEALRPIALEVQRGDFLSLVGPSGCGKSTLLRMIAGLLPPSGGTIEWQGMRPALGFVFQEPTLMPWASVAENISLGLRLQRADAALIAERVDAALELTGLSAFRSSMPRELSGGMRMRVSLARALAVRPEVLLMDEPFAALDEFTREKLNEDLLALWRGQGLTIIFVTHSVYESVYLSTRIAMMAPRPGRIVEEIAVSASPRERAFRSSPVYHALCERVSSRLRAESLSHAA